jgi:hypothetical protein
MFAAGSGRHAYNISVPALLIDKDIAANSSAEVEVTLPQSRVLLFICKLHTRLRG